MIARVDFAFKSSRIVDVGNGAYSLASTKTTSWPLLFEFQKELSVISDEVSFTTMNYDQTAIQFTHVNPEYMELTYAEENSIKNAISVQLGLPVSSILDLIFNYPRIEFTVLGDLSDHPICSATELDGFGPVTSVCRKSRALLSLNVVTKREVLYVGQDLIPTATINIFTAIQYPFVLVNPIHKNKDQALDYTDISGTSTCLVDTDCTRNFEWSMTDNSAKCTFTGRYEVELEVQCSSAFASSLDNEGNPLSCPLAGGETVSMIVDMESANHCPDTFVSIELPPTFLVPTRGSVETKSFLNTQTIEFHADVRANDAGLQQAFFTEIDVQNLDSDKGLQQLYSAQQYLPDGIVLSLIVNDVDENDVPDGTNPLDLNSFLTPSFSFVADAAELGVALSETALLEVTATIEVVFQAGGSEIRRRFLLQARSGDASVQTKSKIILGGSAPVVPAPIVVYNSAMRSGSSTVVAAFSLCTALLVHFV